MDQDEEKDGWILKRKIVESGCGEGWLGQYEEKDICWIRTKRMFGSGREGWLDQNKEEDGWIRIMRMVVGSG